MFGARQAFRRREDKATHRFVDRYSKRSALTVIGIVALSLLDASFTLKLVHIGAATEVNPVMDYFLRLGPIPFLAVKYSLTVGCVVVFLVLKNFHYLSGRVQVSTLLAAVLVLYAILIIYELSLFLRFAKGGALW